MERCKLEYLIRYVRPQELKWKLIDAIDPKNQYEFNFLAVKFLKDPDTTNKYVLMVIPNHHNSENVKAYKEKFVNHFKKINEICIECNVPPFFPDPTNLKECEYIRESLCRLWPEWIINRELGVESYYDFVPPVYDPDKPNNKR